MSRGNILQSNCTVFYRQYLYDVKEVLHPWTLFLKTVYFFKKKKKINQSNQIKSNKATLDKVSNRSDYI